MRCPPMALLVSCAVGLALFFGGANSASADIFFTANITNDQEVRVPPVVPLGRPASSGFGLFRLNDAMTELTFSASIFNIDFTGMQTPGIPGDNLRAAHFHQAPAGSNGGVVFGFIGLPFNDTSPTDIMVTPFATGVGANITGKWDAVEGNNTTLTAQLPALLANNIYINFHTVDFPGGEVRGQLILRPDIQGVPEPASLAVWLIAGVGLVAARGFRRSRP